MSDEAMSIKHQFYRLFFYTLLYSYVRSNIAMLCYAVVKNILQRSVLKNKHTCES